MDSDTRHARPTNPTIWLQAAPATADAAVATDTACGPCANLPSSHQDEPAQLRLSGPVAHLEAVVAALRGVQELREPQDIVASGRVQAIDIAGDEATLTLRMGQGRCVDAHVLAERAFEALRAALPDTDLYLRHDHPIGCAGKAAAGT
ncbi:iron-sulfur cluster assembly protein [Sphaerotilus mobilis]|uniref:Uncharacterized protein DUF59 n=1 Tax=Sphaerotilus mobilis TaxID=47994 RepID=A0A4Q7LKZ5_9BURK|nr:iron-sulfur cluster assembly protein [Sphaerotilus mobilis]RZS54823.1 uncharacterized protein DUF59 [Sphaerotilus mobilis]